MNHRSLHYYFLSALFLIVGILFSVHYEVHSALTWLGLVSYILASWFFSEGLFYVKQE